MGNRKALVPYHEAGGRKFRDITALREGTL